MRAYSLYLWNWPMTILLGPGMLAAGLTFAVGEVSFRLLERPFMRRRAAHAATTPVAVTA